MHYYTFHPKDYMSKTSFLEPLEDLAYRRMLDYQYLNEAPLPEDIDEIAMLISMRSHTDCIATVLHYFFDLTENGYINDRVEREIAKYQEKSEKARKSAEARWNKKPSKSKASAKKIGNDANALQSDCEGNANHEQETMNYERLTNINISFDDFWDLYDYKKGKKSNVEAKWMKLTDSERVAVMENLPAYKASTPDKRFRKQPLVYLNNEAWLDEILYPVSNQTQGANYGQQQSEPSHFDKLRAEAAAKYGNQQSGSNTIRTVNQYDY